MSARQIVLKCKLVILIVLMMITVDPPVYAQEVNKGQIPADQLVTSFKSLPWGAAIWDVDEAVSALKKGTGMVWVDTRPESFFKKGTVRDGLLLIYNKKGMEENTLTLESMATAIKDAGLTKETATVAFFCQGPKCHRSYNAAHVAVTEWGYPPENIVWFRAGYPLLFKAIKGNAKLKRKAKRYISDDGVRQL